MGAFYKGDIMKKSDKSIVCMILSLGVIVVSLFFGWLFDDSEMRGMAIYGCVALGISIYSYVRGVNNGCSNYVIHRRDVPRI